MIYYYNILALHSNKILYDKNIYTYSCVVIMFLYSWELHAWIQWNIFISIFSILSTNYPVSPSHIPISQLHVSFCFSSFFFHNPLSPFSTYGHGHGASQYHGKLASGNILRREWFSLSQHPSSANSFSWGVGRGEHTAHPHILEFWLVWPCAGTMSAVAMSCPEGGIEEHLSPSSSSYSFTVPGPWS